MLDLGYRDGLFGIVYYGISILDGALLFLRFISGLFGVLLAGLRGGIEVRLGGSSMTIPDPADIT